MQQSAEYGLAGYFFVFPPEDTDRWRDAEMPYRIFFYPLILLEESAGSKTLPGNARCGSFE